MRNRCIVCGAKLLDANRYKCKNMPNEAQTLPTRDELENDHPIDYEVCQCSGCGLVQLNCEPVSYYRDSTRAGERCEALVELRQQQFKHLIETYNLNGKKIFEIGAGKGGFLKTLCEMDQYHVTASGIENNPEFVRIAKEIERVDVFEGYLSNEEMHIPGAPFDAFVSFAYPARLTDPNTVLRCMYNNLTEEGIGLVQVPSLEHLLETGGFFDITKDHIAYYSQETLEYLLQSNGYEILELGYVAKIYIYAIVRKRKKIDLAQYWKDIDEKIIQVQSYVKKIKREGKSLAVWCAGHFAFTVLSLSNIGEDVEYIIDNASFKQGRYSPATHVPIYAPDHFQKEPVDNIMILGPIYIDEIVDEIKKKCSSDVTISTMDINGLKEVKV